MVNFPIRRERRLRQTEALRELFCETAVSRRDLIYPIFVEEGLDRPQPVDSMPGVNRIPEKALEGEIEAIARDGVMAVMMFGVSRSKDATGSDAYNPDGLLARMVKRAKHASPELVVIADTCFCEYTDHGHCGVVERGHVLNDLTNKNLGKQAVIAIEAGADMVAPSGMMDGQVAAIRAALDAPVDARAGAASAGPRIRSAYGADNVAAGLEQVYSELVSST